MQDYYFTVGGVKRSEERALDPTGRVSRGFIFTRAPEKRCSKFIRYRHVFIVSPIQTAEGTVAAHSYVWSWAGTRDVGPVLLLCDDSFLESNIKGLVRQARIRLNSQV